jgi:hypothetical protein
MNQKNEQQQKKALEALQSLESYNYKEREVTIGEVKITLAPLMASETIEVFEASSKLDDEDASVQKMKVDVIARSIIKVNDVALDPKSMFAEKLRIVLSFGDELIDVLFDEYCMLDKVIKDTVDKKGLGGTETGSVGADTAATKG